MARASKNPRVTCPGISIETAKRRVAFWKSQPNSPRRRRWLGTWEATLYQLTRIKKGGN